MSKNTVSSAYDELQARDLVESRGRSGLFAKRPKASRAPLRGPLIRSSTSVPAPEFQPFTEVATSPTTKGDSIPLSSVFIDPELLPRERFTECLRSVLKRPGLLTFPNPLGYRPLRERIAERLRRVGIGAEADHIVTTVGSQQVLDLVCRMLSRKSIATENPSYMLGKALFEMNGMRVTGLPVDPFRGVDLAAWEKALKRSRPALAYLTTNSQNPTGYSYTTAELQRILELASELGFGILEDDWGSEMLSFWEFRPSLRALGGDNVIYMNSFTKKLLPSLRIGYALAGEETARSLAHSKRVSISALPIALEVALFEFIDRGYFDRHCRTVQAELDSRYQHCLALLRATMPKGVRWTTPGGGPNLWVELPREVNLAELTKRLAARKVLIRTCESAFIGEKHLHGFMVGYAFLEPKEMERGLERVAEELRCPTFSCLPARPVRRASGAPRGQPSRIGPSSPSSCG